MASASRPAGITIGRRNMDGPRLREREISAVELLEAHIARINERNPEVDALVPFTTVSSWASACQTSAQR